MSKVTRFGKTAKFFIDNLENLQAIDSYCDLESVSSQLKTTCMRFAHLFNEGYIKKDLNSILVMTKEDGDEEILLAYELKIQNQRRATMEETQAPAYNLFRTKGNKIVLKGTKITGVQGKSNANKIAVDEFKEKMKKLGLNVDTVYDEKDPKKVDSYEVSDPQGKVKEKPLYYHLQTLINMGDKFNEVRSAKYDARKNGGSSNEIRDLQTQENRLKMAWHGKVSVHALEMWVAGYNSKGKKDASLTAESKPEREQFLNDMLDDLKELEDAGFVTYNEKEGSTIKDDDGHVYQVANIYTADNDHRTALYENSDKSISELSKIHNEIVAKQEEKKAQKDTQAGTASEEAPKATPSSKQDDGGRANWKNRGSRNR